jgi:hypothetical protein
MTHQAGKWAIKVPFLCDVDDKDNWLYVVQGDSKFHLEPVTYDTFEEASEAGKIWKIFEVVPYNKYSKKE